MLPRFWQRAWKRDGWLRLRFGATLPRSTVGEGADGERRRSADTSGATGVGDAQRAQRGPCDGRGQGRAAGAGRLGECGPGAGCWDGSRDAVGAVMVDAAGLAQREPDDAAPAVGGGGEARAEPRGRCDAVADAGRERHAAVAGSLQDDAGGDREVLGVVAEDRVGSVADAGGREEQRECRLPGDRDSRCRSNADGRGREGAPWPPAPNDAAGWVRYLAEYPDCAPAVARPESRVRRGVDELPSGVDEDV